MGVAIATLGVLVLPRCRDRRNLLAGQGVSRAENESTSRAGGRQRPIASRVLFMRCVTDTQSPGQRVTCHAGQGSSQSAEHREGGLGSDGCSDVERGSLDPLDRHVRRQEPHDRLGCAGRGAQTRSGSRRGARDDAQRAARTTRATAAGLDPAIDQGGPSRRHRGRAVPRAIGPARRARCPDTQ